MMFHPPTNQDGKKRLRAPSPCPSESVPLFGSGINNNTRSDGRRATPFAHQGNGIAFPSTSGRGTTPPLTTHVRHHHNYGIRTSTGSTQGTYQYWFGKSWGSCRVDIAVTPPFHHSQKYWRPTIPLQLSSGIREVCNRAGNTEPPLSSSQEITYPLPPTTM